MLASCGDLPAARPRILLSVQAGREPPGYRDSEMFKLCQKGMENLRQQMREARQGGGHLPAGLPPVAPPGYNKLGASAIAASGGVMPLPPPVPAAAGGSGGVRSSARASARNAAAALAAAAAAGGDEGEDSGGADTGSDWFLPSSGRGSGGRGRGRGSRGGRGGGRGSRGGRGGGRGRGRGRGRASSLSGYSSSSFGALDDLDSDFGFEDTGRVKMMCPARMGGAGEVVAGAWLVLDFLSVSCVDTSKESFPRNGGCIMHQSMQQNMASNS